MPNLLVADLSHYTWDDHGVPDFQAAKASGIVGVIYKATEGANYRDPKYGDTRTLATEAGLLWGAFHFGTAAPLQDQIDNFFNTAAPDDMTLMCLDFEHNDLEPENTMNGPLAIEFMQNASERLQRKLTMYTGSHMYDQFGHQAVPALAPYRLWWAEWVDEPTIPPNWDQYWLWQYTDGDPANGPAPHDVPGFGPCDCNSFDGTAAELANSWIEHV